MNKAVCVVVVVVVVILKTSVARTVGAHPRTATQANDFDDCGELLAVVVKNVFLF